MSVFYSAGLFDENGQGRLNPDNRIDVMGRVFVHPLYSSKDALKDLQIGASFRHGRRDPDYMFYDYPSMTTQGGFQFWGPTYYSSKGVTRILPSGSQTALAAEARIPVSRFDVTSEFVWVHNGTRESVDGTESTIRLTANYVMNTFPDSAPAKGAPAQTSSQRAIAPGNTIGAGIDDTKRQEAHVLHELLFRAAVAF